ncbi:MAG: hypothetical protein HDR89_06775 [Bacteroides sp.]|nr:hypothetical protein [Bacteroides sp.]
MKHPHTPSDREFADRLHRLLPDAPPHPMFTRMVINRLPRRSVRILSLLEYTLYIIGIATTGVIATRMIIEMSHAAEVPLNTTLTLLTLITIFFSLLYALILPFATRK